MPAFSYKPLSNESAGSVFSRTTPRFDRGYRGFVGLENLNGKTRLKNFKV